MPKIKLFLGGDAGCLCAGRVSGRKEICDMVGANCRIKLFRLVKPSHTAFRTARGKRTKSSRDKQVGHAKKVDKPPPAVSESLCGLLNAHLTQIADCPFFYGIGNLFFHDDRFVGCRDPPG